MQAIRSGIRALRSSSSSSGSFLNVVSSSSISASAKVGVIGGARVYSQTAPAYSPNSLEKHEVTTRVLDLLRSIPFIDPSKVSATADFKKDLQLDMLDSVEVIMAAEEEFALDIPDNDAQKIATTAHLIDYVTGHPQAK
ncbi:hypothetical protein SLE2022_079220 [Rubroshorea leprosula]